MMVTASGFRVYGLGLLWAAVFWITVAGLGFKLMRPPWARESSWM